MTSGSELKFNLTFSSFSNKSEHSWLPIWSSSGTQSFKSVEDKNENSCIPKHCFGQKRHLSSPNVKKELNLNTTITTSCHLILTFLILCVGMKILRAVLSPFLVACGCRTSPRDPSHPHFDSTFLDSVVFVSFLTQHKTWSFLGLRLHPARSKRPNKTRETFWIWMTFKWKWVCFARPMTAQNLTVLKC